MRTSSSSTVLVFPLLALAGLFSATPASSQKPPYDEAQAATQYASKKAIPAVLTLTADNQNARPNQSIHFTLSWNRPVYRVTYHYDWNDNRTEDRTDLAADHTYATPGSYTVRVTASAIASPGIARTNLQKVSIQSNAVTILVVSPQQPTASLTADKTNPAVDDTVVFTAIPSPTPPSATYLFNFDDDTPQPPASNLNRIEHIYRRAGTFHPTVVVSNDGEQWAASPPVEIIVTPPPPPPPPNLTVRRVGRGNPVVGSEVVVAATLDPLQPTASFEFDWGDGSEPQKIGVQGVADHIYTTAGPHPVIVTAETEQAYVPPLQSTLPLYIRPPDPPPALWPKILGWALPIALIAFATGRHFNRPKFTHSLFQYVAFPGSAVHQIKTAQQAHHIGSMTLSTGMGPAEHTITFHDHAEVPVRRGI